jgi:hypothetical protein
VRGFDDVEVVTLEWVAWFNQERLLAPLGYVPPAEFVAQYYDTHHTHKSMGVLNQTSLLKTRGGSVCNAFSERGPCALVGGCYIRNNQPRILF